MNTIPLTPLEICTQELLNAYQRYQAFGYTRAKLKFEHDPKVVEQAVECATKLLKKHEIIK